MTKFRLNQILNYGPWVEEEGLASFCIIDHCKTCYIDSIYVHKKKFFKTCIYSVFNNYAREWTSREDAENLLMWLLKNLKSNRRFLEEKDKFFTQVYKHTQAFSNWVQKQDFHSITNAELLKIFQQASALNKKQYGYSLITESTDLLTEKDYAQVLKGLTPKFIPDIVRTLSLPARRTFFDEFGIREAEVALTLKRKYRNKPPTKFKDLQDPKIKAKVIKLQQSFYWLDNSFKVARTLSAVEIYEKVKTKLKSLSESELNREKKNSSRNPAE